MIKLRLQLNANMSSSFPQTFLSMCRIAPLSTVIEETEDMWHLIDIQNQARSDQTRKNWDMEQLKIEHFSTVSKVLESLFNLAFILVLFGEQLSYCVGRLIITRILYSSVHPQTIISI